jgi:hypothetical protein
LIQADLQQNCILPRAHATRLIAFRHLSGYQLQDHQTSPRNWALSMAESAVSDTDYRFPTSSISKYTLQKSVWADVVRQLVFEANRVERHLPRSRPPTRQWSSQSNLMAIESDIWIPQIESPITMLYVLKYPKPGGP